MLGSATFTTLASSTTMNWATATTASTALALTRTGRATSPGVMATSDMAGDLSHELYGLHDHHDAGESSSPNLGDRTSAVICRSSSSSRPSASTCARTPNNAD